MEGIGSPKESPSDLKLGNVWNEIQAKYGAKPEKPREIKKTLGKDDFLRIMITQMKHQDPTQPFKAEQFAAELAQYTTVEQLQNMNQSLGKMSNQNQPMERLAMTNLIGKTVTVDRERFPHTEGSPDALSFVLPKDASEVHLAIQGDNGETLFEKDMGPQKAGAVTFDWDGIRSNTLPAKTGNYLMRVQAKGDQGQTIQTNPLTKSKVVGVSFEGHDPVFLVGNPNQPEKVLMRNIARIESEGPLIPGVKPINPTKSEQTEAQAEAVPAQEQQAANPNFFTFKKGVGSSNLNSLELTPEAAEALVKYQKTNPVEKGFPNGLHDSSDSIPNPNDTLVKGGDKK